MSDQPASSSSPSVQIQFQPFTSAVDVSFWSQLGKLKLDEWHLDSTPKEIQAAFGPTTHQQVPSQLCLGSYSFPSHSSGSLIPSSLPGRSFGRVHNANTMEAFKAFAPQALLDAIREEMWKQMKEHLSSANAGQTESLSSIVREKKGLSAPSLDEILSKFILLTFADLKTHKYAYWFCYPSLVLDGVQIIANGSAAASAGEGESKSALEALGGTEAIEQVWKGWAELYVKSQSSAARISTNAFIILQRANGLEVLDLDVGIAALKKDSQAKYFLSFIDPSPLSSNMGWSARNILNYFYLATGLGMDAPVQILAFRDTDLALSVENGKGRGSQSTSRVFSVSIRSLHSPAHLLSLPTAPKAVGWERNLKTGKLAPKTMDLGALMQPEQLAEQSVDLNLKLMRWRALPELDLPLLSRTKCLLLGSGTLGCNVARALLGWGVRHITFVDNGRVSYSNPVRQSLFGFADAKAGASKALAAASAMKAIHPNVHCISVEMTIPMPGHAVSPTEEQDVRATIKHLAELIEQHDAIFLLTDSRESRWLPTVMAAAKNKMVLNTALGFDTYVVMRHGDNYVRNGSMTSAASASSSASPATSSTAAIPPSSCALGCYFCNDVVAPTDSLSDRTLDQQCTVTRPGLAFISSALVVELFVTLLHHPLQQRAPADLDSSSSVSVDGRQSGFGLVPHQLRGFLARYHTTLVRGEAFTKCTACSQVILDSYLKEPIEFVLSALNQSTRFLEDLSGLTQMKLETERMMESIEVDGITDEESDDF